LAYPNPDVAPSPMCRGMQADSHGQLVDRYVGQRATDAIGVFHPPPKRVPLTQLAAARKYQSGIEGIDRLTRSPIPGWVDMGLGGNDGTPIGCDLATKPGIFAVVGASGSGRTNVLMVMLTQLLHASNPIVVAKPHSPLAILAAEFGVRSWRPDETAIELSATQGRTTVVLIDDVTALVQTQLSEALLNLHESKDIRSAIVVAGRGDDFSSAYNGLGHAARQGRTGLLLSTTAHEGELFGLRVPPSSGTQPVGRALLISQEPHLDAHRHDNGTVPLQLALHDRFAATSTTV
jgi:hypothetical protein